MTEHEINSAIEQHVFGDDLTANPTKGAELGHAILSDVLMCSEMYLKCTGIYHDIGECPRIYKGIFDSDRYGLWVWDSRVGEPWQDAIEQYVREYRRQPRQFCSDRNLLPLVLQQLNENESSALNDATLTQSTVMWLQHDLKELMEMVLDVLDDDEARWTK